MLVRIWIRRSVPVPLTNISGSGSCYFGQWPSKDNNYNLFCHFFAYYFLKLHLHHFSKIHDTKQYLCLLKEGSGSGSVPRTKGPDLDPGGPKTYGSGSATFLVWEAFVRIRSGSADLNARALNPDMDLGWNCYYRQNTKKKHGKKWIWISFILV